MRTIRQRNAFVTMGLALLAAALLPALAPDPAPDEATAGFAENELWHGKWRTDAGRVKFSQDGEEVTGKWKCGCEDDRRALIDGKAYPSDTGRKARGEWYCRDGSDDGRFRIKQNAEHDEFTGFYTAESVDNERVDWTGHRR